MLADLREVLKIGKERGIAIGSFNTPTLESLLAVVKAAEELEVPVIVMHAQIHENVSPINDIGRVMITIAKASKTKVCVHLDHGEDIDYIKKAIKLGFTSVMTDNSAFPYEENVRKTKEVVYYAHCCGVDVEAELGKLPQREGGGGITNNSADLYTNPDLVIDFIEKTHIDALAIAFGTAHGIYKTPPVLNLDIINKVRAKTDIPLVMHGGSGISNEIYRDVIKRGINKINYYTYMAYAGFAMAKKVVDSEGQGFYHDLAAEAQEAMEENVLATLKVFSNK